MNQKNLEFLKDGIKYLGFSEGLNGKLTEEITSGKPEFKLNTVNEYNRDKVDYTLEFRKSQQSDMYFFNRYTATIKGDDSANDKTQTFYINKNAGITAKEAYNLLNGRAVNKDLLNAEGQKFNAWLQLNFDSKDDNGNHKFRQFTTGYGYDLEKELAKHPLKELSDPLLKERLMQSIERGNLHQVTFARGDREDKMFIEANPQFKTLNIYDASMKKVFQEHEKKEAKPEQQQDSGESKRQEQKKDKANEVDDESPNKGKRTFSRKGIGI